MAQILVSFSLRYGFQQRGTSYYSAHQILAAARLLIKELLAIDYIKEVQVRTFCHNVLGCID